MKVRVHRGNYVESEHAVSWIVMDFNSQVISFDGDPLQKMFPRSALKMLQALPFLKLKKQLGQNISQEHIACACASHAGEVQHVQVVSSWLKEIGLNESSLHCGCQPPFDEASKNALIKADQAPTRLHNNCSGKHASQLEYALLLKAPTESYYSADHPVQKNIQSLISEMAKESVIEWGIDGCGIPAWRMTLKGFANAMAAFGKNTLVENSAESQVFKAFTALPQLTSGKEEFCAQAMAKFPGELMIKVGAEGVMTAVIPKANLCIVLKVHDGAERAAEAAVASLISEFIPEMKSGLNQWSNPIIKNWSGTKVGSLDAKL